MESRLKLTTGSATKQQSMNDKLLSKHSTMDISSSYTVLPTLKDLNAQNNKTPLPLSSASLLNQNTNGMKAQEATQKEVTSINTTSNID